MTSWTIEFSPRAAKALRKLDRPVQKRIVAYLREISTLPNPQMRGKALTGNWAGFWRWRVGDYRLVAAIEDDRVVIVVVSIGHRSQVYED
ncbi:type II toxin-antitoxin system RelE family toxin [Corynebacterium diphtheriae]|uniref:type II toxin-antitoxin system RelE family toxin n=1 Tax=Corynebacterium diphtheriae TaxID=1717 RepID=UPI000B4A723B|nr:type II toxin-antitoxin system RelE/ParE family toxin [Corynebacterium diphtheriae]OWN38155.1 addiction module toxin RelE [Corynebacterium belfantii]MBG9294409.1 type II toxin-antitoxin system RelE/ParE family toxin [Corynebacterium diphtheriae bv. mitis]MBG9317016.1 type II toxin-antitoxin system RelE/ParE family toxin [Corynebacterium diphtheriae bv. mitis]OWN00087.1 addiction module toxin RelE [Corynebacterium diphtheriae bv. mitis]OWN25341.1 addiction module toxin RelE [Corynebacterium 